MSRFHKKRAHVFFKRDRVFLEHDRVLKKDGHVLKKDGDPLSPLLRGDVGLFIGCMMYHHTVEIVTQTVKWLVLVVQVL